MSEGKTPMVKHLLKILQSGVIMRVMTRLITFVGMLSKPHDSFGDRLLTTKIISLTVIEDRKTESAT